MLNCKGNGKMLKPNCCDSVSLDLDNICKNCQTMWKSEFMYSPIGLQLIWVKVFNIAGFKGVKYE